MSELRLENVTVSRGAGPVISDVSLEVRAGEITTIVGPNGAGKTSLLESISGVVRPTSGRITIDGTDVTKASRGARAKHGIVHVEQGRAIFKSLTVRENIELTARTNDAFDEVMGMFPELEKRLTSRSELLSGGEQQMVVLGRAFAAKPRALLIDEMSLGLAPVVFMRLVPIVKQIAESGVGVLLVEQFAALALGAATDAYVFSSGRITYSGPAKDIATDPVRLHKAYLG